MLLHADGDNLLRASRLADVVNAHLTCQYKKVELFCSA